MTTLFITTTLRIDDSEIDMSAIRAQGAGGQNVNKVSSAIHLRFDVAASSLPEHIKARLLAKADTRLTAEGVFVLKAQNFRTQEQNRQDAIDRLSLWIGETTKVQKTRRPTRVSKGVQKRRAEAKKQQSQRKDMRKKVDY